MRPDPINAFSWHFLEEVARWTLGVSAAGVVVATLLGNPAFAFAWALTVAVDVALVYVAARRGERAADPGGFDRTALVLFTGVRFAVKVGLIIFAAVFPAILSFWGTVIGALSYDVVLMVVGSVVAARQTLSGGR